MNSSFPFRPKSVDTLKGHAPTDFRLTIGSGMVNLAPAFDFRF